jgi:hypothetical protein
MYPIGRWAPPQFHFAPIFPLAAMTSSWPSNFGSLTLAIFRALRKKSAFLKNV